MKIQKHVLVRTDNEQHIAVLNLGTVHTDKELKMSEYVDKHKIEPKVVEALKDHFCCPVKIISTNIISDTPITINVEVIVESEEQDHQETVYLEEIVVY